MTPVLGRPVTVSAIAIGCGGEYDAKMQLAAEHLETSGENGVDIACLPEAFASLNAEPIPGPTTDAIARFAKRYGMYVLCPIVERADGTQYNTAVLIGRDGSVIGSYRKVYVFWGENSRPSRDGVRVYDLDFGRISIFTCFDVNFPEIWQEADELDVELVLWPSAYGGGMPLNAYAMLYHYPIVPVGWGNLIDITGENLADVLQPRPGQTIATLDLDRVLIHENFTGDKVRRLIDNGEAVIERHFEMEAWWLLRAAKPGVRARDLCKRDGIETLREYQQRSRRQINEIRFRGGLV